jgi:hypothetical protein
VGYRFDPETSKCHVQWQRFFNRINLSEPKVPGSRWQNTGPVEAER